MSFSYHVYHQTHSHSSTPRYMKPGAAQGVATQCAVPVRLGMPRPFIPPPPLDSSEKLCVVPTCCRQPCETTKLHPASSLLALGHRVPGATRRQREGFQGLRGIWRRSATGTWAQTPASLRNATKSVEPQRAAWRTADTAGKDSRGVCAARRGHAWEDQRGKRWF